MKLYILTGAVMVSFLLADCGYFKGNEVSQTKSNIELTDNRILNLYDAFGKKNEQIFLGREISQHRDYSEQTAQAIDEEVSSIITSCKNEAKKILKANYEKFESIAVNLIERETLDAEEIKMLMNGEKLPELKNNKSDKEKSEAPKKKPVSKDDSV